MPLWLIPMAYTIASILAGLIIPPLEFAYAPALGRLASVSSAQAFLSAASSGMMALTGIVFSIGVIVFQLTTAMYSKRLTSLLSRNPVMYHALGMFVATFVYSLSALPWVDRGGSGRVPFLSMWLVSALLVASMVFLSLLVHRIGLMQVTRVLRIVGNQGRLVIRQTYLVPHETMRAKFAKLRARGAQVCAGKADRTITYSGDPEAIASIDVAALVRSAREAGAILVLECAVGDVVDLGTVLLRAYGNGRAVSEDAVLAAIHLNWERTFEQDPKYPIRLLVDTAIMALSPAVNDPTTAVQAIDQIEDLMHRILRSEIDVGYAADENRRAARKLSMPTWDDFLALAFTEIRHCGAGSVQVVRRLRAALLSLAAAATDDEQAESVRNMLALLDRTIERQNYDPEDRALVMREDRQGIGVSRG